MMMYVVGIEYRLADIIVCKFSSKDEANTYFDRNRSFLAQSWGVSLYSVFLEYMEVGNESIT